MKPVGPKALIEGVDLLIEMFEQALGICTSSLFSMKLLSELKSRLEITRFIQQVRGIESGESPDVIGNL
jgi:hypothetical protein